MTLIDKAEALLPCPFCGGEAIATPGPIPNRWGASCLECDCWLDTRAATQAEAIAAWNRRALPTRGVGVPTERPDAPAHIVEYTNWRGETARRTIIPLRMWWGSTEWHPEEQWMLTAWDVEKDAPRDFAWQDMRSVQNGATSAAVAAQRAALAPTDAAHVNETPKSEHDGADVLTAARARDAAMREAAAWAMNHVSTLPMDEATQSEFMRHRAALPTEERK